MVKLTVLGCTHGAYNQLKLEGGDLLILTGDYTARDTHDEYHEFVDWVEEQNYKKKIVIGGNHDMIMKNKGIAFSRCNFDYLCDSGTEFEYEEQAPHPASSEEVVVDGLFYETKKLKIWGMPHSLSFRGINPHCTAWTGDEHYISEKCKLIPKDIDILISHSPPWGILDEVEDYYSGRIKNTGSTSIRSVVLDKFTYPNLKYNFFSHIHEQGGKMVDLTSAKFYNCSIMNEIYKPVNKPLQLEI